MLDGERKDGTDEREMKTQGWRGTFVFESVQPFDSKTIRRTFYSKSRKNTHR